MTRYLTLRDADRDYGLDRRLAAKYIRQGKLVPLPGSSPMLIAESDVLRLVGARRARWLTLDGLYRAIERVTSWPEDWLPTDRIPKMVGCSVRTVQAWIAGERSLPPLEAARVKGSLSVSKTSLLAHLEALKQCLQ